MGELAAALLVTLILTWPVRAFLLRRGMLDVPNSRSSHTSPVPRGGGVACAAGFVVSLALASTSQATPPWLSIGAVLVLAGTGLEDDRRGLPANLRLALQAASGAAAGVAIGGPAWGLAGAVGFPIAVNVVNFMDGINGITGLTLAAWGAVAATLGLVRDTPALASLGFATAGAALGFLPWNIPTARVFLGDSGSYLFGAIVAVGVLMAASHGLPAHLLVAPLSLYLGDTAWTLTTRALRHEPLMVAHRHHVYQRLVGDGGFNHVLVSAAVAGLGLAVTAVWWQADARVGVPVTVAVLAGYIASPRLVGRRPEGGAHVAA